MNLPDFKNIKLIATDMDGTLLNSKHEVSNEFFSLFEELKRLGVVFVAASGRQYNSILEKLDSIKNDIYIIAENGGMATYRNQDLFRTPFPQSFLIEQLKLIEQHSDIHPVLCSRDTAFIRDDRDHFHQYVKEFYTTYECIGDLKTCQSEILKIALYHIEGSEKNIYPLVKHLEEDLQVKVSGPNWVDLSHMNCNKGYALNKLQQTLGISKENTLVFGDYNNDLEMMREAKYSVAMANSHPNVLSLATHKTLSNDELGVEKVLKKVIEDLA